MPVDVLNSPIDTTLGIPQTFDTPAPPEAFMQTIAQIEDESKSKIRQIQIALQSKTSNRGSNGSYQATLKFLESANLLEHLIISAAKVVLPTKNTEALRPIAHRVVIGAAKQESDKAHWQQTSVFIAIDIETENIYEITIYSQPQPYDLISNPGEPDEYELSSEAQESAHLDTLSKVVHFCLQKKLMILGSVDERVFRTFNAS